MVVCGPLLPRGAGTGQGRLRSAGADPQPGIELVQLPHESVATAITLVLRFVFVSPESLNAGPLPWLGVALVTFPAMFKVWPYICRPGPPMAFPQLPR